MNIRRFSNALIFGMAVLMVLLITLVWLTFETSKQAATAERLRHESYVLATEMKHSLDQLMIMVRLYSNRNMPQYEEYFQRILAIRDGKVPRPANYSEFYWDYVLGRPGYSQPAGETVSLEELMRRQRFTDAEFALLDEAHRRAAGLARIEQQAFAAMKGLFIDERGELIGQGEPDPALARRLLNSDEYLAQRAHIMEPLDAFIRSVESRTRRELDELQRVQAMYVRFALALTLIGAALGVPVALYTLRRIVRPIDRLVEHANHIATRNYGSRNTVAGDDELGILGTTLNTMSAAIECDIDARREVERELADQLHFQEQLLDAIPNPLYFKDTIGRYLGCNRAYEEAFGVTREYMRGRTVFDLEFVPEQLRRQYQDQTLDIVRDGGLHYREAALRYADGTSHTVMYWLAAFDLMDGRRGGVIGVLVDFTRHKQMERALGEARDVAEAATQAKASFLAAMSHEIRTPMNGIIGMIDLLNQTRMEPDQMHMLGTVRDSAFALLTIINDILDFSKIESGRLELESIPISLRDAVEGVADTLAPNARKRGIQFATFIDPSLPRRVLGDQVRLRQILFNLAGNAIKFTEDKAERRGRVEIRAESVGSEAGGVRVRFTIVDNGIGIDRDKLPELFQPFTQAEQSTTRRFGGSGLGLSICKRLAEMMGGTVGVDSVKGQGSTFWAELPFAGVEDQSDGVETEDLSGLYVHVVTTDPAECQILMRYLRHWGAAVVTIDGDDPVAAVHSTSAKRAPDVIVIGEQPGSGDMALYERLCSHPLLARTRYVVLCTDRGDRQLATPDRVIVETNPMRRSSLVRGVAIAGGRASPEIPRTEELAADREEYERSRAEASRHRILVAEDNVTNQDVIRRQLDRLGYPCDVVGNGVEALDALHQGGYAVLLTDCHMPEMDGYDLARNIRIGERGQPIRLPIVAITANALKGEAERCLEAGMDDYLPKPLEMEKLKRMLRKWTAGHGVLEAQATVERSVELAPAPAPDSAELPAVDPAALQEVFGDDAATFKEILIGFASASPPIVVEIESAAQAGDAVAAGSAAHKLKSAARAVGAHPLADLSYRIEQAGRSGDLHEVQAGVATLQSTMHAVLKYIAAL